MKRISQQTIETVINSTEIFDVVKEYVVLKKNGANYTGRCPFHNEKSASFVVNTARQIYKCFGCGKGGGAINFLMDNQNMSYPEAIEHIANKQNISIIYDEISKSNIDDATQTEKLSKILASTERKYIEQYNISQVAQEYIQNRGYNGHIVLEWRIGYAPANNFIRKIASELGIISDCVDAGILSQKDGNTYDVYQNRIIFPIYNHLGKLVGFGGRIIEKDSKYAKYLNSRDSKLYNKSNVLYGLNKANFAIKEKGFAILVEGYTDVISFHYAGANNTVATCGTALTDSHCKLLKRYTDHIVIARDGDDAGINATDKDINILLSYGFKVEVMTIEKGIDPDDLAKQFFTKEEIIEETV